LIIILLFRIILLSRLKKEIKKKEIKISVPPLPFPFFSRKKITKAESKKESKSKQKIDQKRTKKTHLESQ
jgi:hypothetical protein